MNSTLLDSIEISLRSEGDAYRALEEVRWCDGEPICPHCGGTRTSYLTPLNGVSRATRTGNQSQRRVWICEDCWGQFSVLTGSVLHGTKLSLRVLVSQVISPMHVRGVMRANSMCHKSARRVLDFAESIRSDGLVQVRETNYNPSDFVPEWLRARMSGIWLVELDRCIDGTPLHDAVTSETGGDWADPTFDAVLRRLHAKEMEHRARVYDWNLDHAQSRLVAPDTSDLVAVPSFASGLSHHMSSRHRGRNAQSALMRGRRNSRKSRAQR